MDRKSNIMVIETMDEDGKELKLAIKTPGHKILHEAQMVYNIELTRLIKLSVSQKTQLLSRQQLDQHLDSLGVWTEEDGRQFLRLQLELRSLDLKLRQGGIKLSEAKKIALKMKTKRAVLLILYSRRSQFDEITMESIAENQKFKFLLTKCVMIDESGIQFFVNIEDYETRQSEVSAIDAAVALAGQLYGYDKNSEADLIENKWLKQFKFADDKGRLINDDGKLIDMDGRLVNEKGRFVNEHGKFIDDQGRLVDNEGNFVVKTKPFIDDKTGKPFVTKKRKSNNKKE